MAATVYNFTIEQGIPYSCTFLVKNTNGSNKDLTGYTARMQIRSYASSTVVVVEATTANSKLVINTGASTCSIALTEADTAGLSLLEYVYDIELVSSTNIPLRLVQGKITNSREVTK